MSDGIYSCPMDPMDSYERKLRKSDGIYSCPMPGTPTIGVLSPMDVRFSDRKQMMESS